MMKFDNEGNDINSRNYCKRFGCFNKWTSQRNGKIHIRRVIDFETFISMIIIEMNWKHGTLEMKLLLIFKIRNFQ